MYYNYLAIIVVQEINEKKVRCFLLNLKKIFACLLRNESLSFFLLHCAKKLTHVYRKILAIEIMHTKNQFRELK